MSLASLRSHSAALVDALNAELKTFYAGGPDLDLTPGVADAWGWQGTPGQSKFKPYAILYPLPGGIFDGTIGCPDDDASLIWQVTCVGATAEQCEWVCDLVNDTLIGQTLTVTGRHISRVWADMAGGGVRRDDEVQPPVFIATPRFRAESAPGS